MIVRLAHFGAVIADLGAERAVVLGEFAIDRHQADASLQHFDTLYAAVRAVVHALFSRHFGQANFTVDEALLAGFDTFDVGKI